MLAHINDLQRAAFRFFDHGFQPKAIHELANSGTRQDWAAIEQQLAILRPLFNDPVPVPESAPESGEVTSETESAQWKGERF